MSLNKRTSRIRRKMRIRKKVSGTPERPRLSVFKSIKHIYAQLVDDLSGKTLISVSSKEKGFAGSGGNVAGAKNVGETLGQKAAEKGIKKAVFDRGGYVYHGRIRALADGAREKGLEF